MGPSDAVSLELAKQTLQHALHDAVPFMSVQGQRGLEDTSTIIRNARTREDLLEPSVLMVRGSLCFVDVSAVKFDLAMVASALEAVAALWSGTEAFCRALEEQLSTTYDRVPSPPGWSAAVESFLFAQLRADVVSAMEWRNKAQDAGLLDGFLDPFLVHRAAHDIRVALARRPTRDRLEYVCRLADTCMSLMPPIFLRHKAAAQRRLGLYEEALRSLSDAIAASRGIPLIFNPALRDLMGLMLHLGRSAEVESWADGILSTCPPEDALHAELHLIRGGALFHQARYEEALMAFRVGAASPSYAEEDRCTTAAHIATILCFMEQYDEAEATCNEGLALARRDSERVVLHSVLLRVYARTWHSHRALAELASVLALDPEDEWGLLHELYTEMGKLHIDLQEWVQAAESLERAVALEPTAVIAHLNLLIISVEHSARMTRAVRSTSFVLCRMLRALSVDDATAGHQKSKFVCDMILLAEKWTPLASHCQAAILEGEDGTLREIEQFFLTRLTLAREMMPLMRSDVYRLVDAMLIFTDGLVLLARRIGIDHPASARLQVLAQAYRRFARQHRRLSQLPKWAVRARLVQANLGLDYAAQPRKIARVLSRHGNKWFTGVFGSTTKSNRAELLRDLESFLFEMAECYRYADHHEKRRFLQWMHSYLEVLPSHVLLHRHGELRHTRRSRSKLFKWLSDGLPERIDDVLLSFSEIQGRLLPNEILLRAYLFHDHPAGQVLLVWAVGPAGVLRLKLFVADDLSELKTFERIQRVMLKDPNASAHELSAVLSKALGHPVAPEALRTSIQSWQDACLGRLSRYLFGENEAVNVEGKDLILSPPVEWNLPWLALPLPRGRDRTLADAARSVRVAPSLSLRSFSGHIKGASSAAVFLQQRGFSRRAGTDRAAALQAVGLGVERIDLDAMHIRSESDDQFAGNVVERMKGRKFAIVQAHYHEAPTIDLPGVLPLHRLIDALHNHTPLGTDAVILECCHAASVHRPISEQFENLALAFLISGVRQVVAPIYSLVPQTQGEIFFSSLSASGFSGSLPEGVVAATRRLRLVSADLPLGPLAAFWAPFVVLSQEDHSRGDSP